MHMKFDQMSEEDQLDYLENLKYGDFNVIKNDAYGHRIVVNEGNFNWLMAFGTLKLGDGVIFKGPVITHKSSYSCRGCGEYFDAIASLDLDNKTIQLEHVSTPVESKCIEHIDQMIFNLKIKCPSGKLVFGNDLRYIKEFHEVNKISSGIDINYKSECVRSMELYADAGFMYLQCGNSCPNVYKMPDGTILIGDACSYDEDAGEFSDDPYYEGSEYIDGICTDLWAVHAIDHDVYMKYHDDLIDDHFIVDVSHLGTELNIEYHYNFDRGSNVLGKITGKK